MVRLAFMADSGRAIQISLAHDPAAQLEATLLEPGGYPSRSEVRLEFASHLGDLPLEIDAADVISGLYQIEVRNKADRSTAVHFRVTPAPVELGASLSGGQVRIAARNLLEMPVAVRFRVGLRGAVRDLKVDGRGNQPVRLALPRPEWATEATVDLQLAAVQWVRMMDLQLAMGNRETGPQSTLRRSWGRVSTDALQDDSLIVWLTPRFVEGTTALDWNGTLRVEYRMDPLVEIDPGGSPMRTAGRNATVTESFPMQPAAPRPMPTGFDPLVQIVAIQSADYTWWHAVRLRSSRSR